MPSYNPTVVYGAPVYPYPPIYYPPYHRSGIAASAISFGVGVAMGAAWGGGGWGWNCGWGGNDINVNVNNNFNRNTNISGGNRVNNIQGGNRNNQRRRQVATQSAASRRSALREQGHCKSLRRDGAWRFVSQPTIERASASRPARRQSAEHARC